MYSSKGEVVSVKINKILAGQRASIQFKTFSDFLFRRSHTNFDYSLEQFKALEFRQDFPEVYVYLKLRHTDQVEADYDAILATSELLPENIKLFNTNALVKLMAMTNISYTSYSNTLQKILGAPQTVDGLLTSIDDILALNGQTLEKENGIWKVTAYGDEWRSGRVYTAGQFVIQSSLIYEILLNHTAVDFAQDTIDGKISNTNIIAWVTNTVYQPDDKVIYNGSIYKCLSNPNTLDPNFPGHTSSAVFNGDYINGLWSLEHQLVYGDTWIRHPEASGTITEPLFIEVTQGTNVGYYYLPINFETKELIIGTVSGEDINFTETTNTTAEVISDIQPAQEEIKALRIETEELIENGFTPKWF